MCSKIFSLLIALLMVTAAGILSSRAQSTTAWDGQWVAEGTLFEIMVSVVGGIMTIGQIESLGQVWTNEDGTVDNTKALVPVSYAGASGIVQAELVDYETARVSVASCEPEFLVVCTLSRDHQVIFKKLPR